jgi:RimJ/RimL family protein N-acetyltransferase
MDDLPLYMRQSTDPGMMSNLGGPLAEDGLEDKPRGIVDDVRAGRVWYFVIVPDDDPTAGAGTVCIWDHEEGGKTISEIGWMVLPEYQGRGLATKAVRTMLDRAREQGRWKVVHAFPGVPNQPSNAICRKLGFTRLEEREIQYADRTLHCNHWKIDLRADGSS